MKPQIILSVLTLSGTVFFFAASGIAAGKNENKIKTVANSFRATDNKMAEEANESAEAQLRSNRPFKNQQRENKNDNTPFKEASHKKSHTEEDGKHHHFHLYRAKKIKYWSGLVCMAAKFLIVISHICLLFYVYHSLLAHVAH